ncbi:MAG: UDP-N-acetylenolpyruvoylglucosamine reductase [Flavobacteriales bacterium]|nr:UDP-N-acetylenolpyruvoylglucosamine reductase [Flavobacteriales bacterium]|tara:strand:+ start:9569 stop:10567 length:999 start_codon:yes stop_codon:yes gene_type:complete
MNIKKNFSLKFHNTFKINVKANFFIEVFSKSDLFKIFDNDELVKMKKLILGAGSNILFTKNFDGLILNIKIKGISEIRENFIKVYSGENWHKFVMWSLTNNYTGIENLSLIPGSVGAAPIQNIGAYGVEVKDVIYKVEVFNIYDKKIEVLDNSACKFKYRTSIFKNEFKEKYIIISVIFKLQRNGKLNLDYQELKNKLTNIINPTSINVSEAIISIRKNKLPDVNSIGNAGSFFKNPIISKDDFKKLIKKFPSINFKIINANHVKISAGWLIESSGWKGYKKNNFGVYEKHALILVNFDDASGFEINDLANKIKNSVKDKFNINLDTEVNIL